MRPEEHERDAVEHVADLLAELVDGPGVAPERQPEGHARDERRDEARAAERVGRAVGERGAGGRDHLPPRAGDQVPAAGVDDDRRDHEPADHPADDPVADLLEQQRRRAAAARDLRLDVGERHGREQQRHADPVVEPALDVEPLADPLGTRGSVTTACPSAASVGASTTPRITASSIVSCAEDRGRRDGAERDRQRQPDRRAGAAARRRRARSCRRSMREASQNSTSASVASASVRTVALVLGRSIPSSTLGPDQQADGDEHHRRRDRRPRQPPRDRGDAEQSKRDDGKGPLHAGSAAQTHLEVADAHRPVGTRSVTDGLHTIGRS